MTTQTARKGDPGHVVEDRERTTATPGGRERLLGKRIQVERDRAKLETKTRFGYHPLGFLSLHLRSLFGEHGEKGRGRWPHARKAGPGRRPALGQRP
jgi:hypothetical protein